MNRLKRPKKRLHSDLRPPPLPGTIVSTSPSHRQGHDPDFQDTSPVEETKQAFAVMWNTFKPGKKHKMWDDDAILVRKGRLLVLKDLKGREIEKEFGFPVTRRIEEGDLIRICGKECKIETVLDYSDYESERCFQPNFDCTRKDPVAPVTTRNPQNFLTNRHPPSNSTNSLPVARTLDFVRPQVSMNILPQFKPVIPDHTQNVPPFFLPPLGSENEQPVQVDPKLVAFLRPHQKVGIEFMYQCVMGLNRYGRGCILADEMGLGKTLQCITLIHTLLNVGPFGKPVMQNVLILTPSSLIKNWRKEFEKWLEGRRFYVYPVDGKKKTFGNYLKQKRGLYPVLIVSYETFTKNYLQLASVQFDLLVCDEGHRLKNSKIKVTQAIQEGLKVDRKIFLTGTPIQNDLEELFNLSNMVNPNCLGSPHEFKRKFEGPILASRQPNACLRDIELGEKCLFDMLDVTGTFILRRKQEEIQQYLPSKIEQVVICKPTNLQAQIYEAVLKHDELINCLESIEKSSTPIVSYLPYISFLRKLCNHPFLVCPKYNQTFYKMKENSLIKQLAPITQRFLQQSSTSFDQKSGKFDTLCQMLKVFREAGQKVVIVSNFTQTLDLIARYCISHQYPITRLDGNTPSNMRQAIVDQFNQNNSFMFAFLLSSKAGGCGLNLVGASNLILYDIDWNPANDLQAMARIWRDGQSSTANIYRLITAGTIEERMFQRQIMKMGLNCAIQNQNGSVEGGGPLFNKKELKDIFTVNTNVLSLTHDAIKCECRVGLPMSNDDGENCTPTSSPDHYEINEDENQVLVDNKSLLLNQQNTDFSDDTELFDVFAQNQGSIVNQCYSQHYKSDHVSLLSQQLDSDDNEEKVEDDDFTKKPIDFDSLNNEELLEALRGSDFDENPSKRIKINDCLNPTNSLDEWEHIAHPFDNCELDKALVYAQSYINFIFRNVIKKA